jgi:hypothetical protein
MATRAATITSFWRFPAFRLKGFPWFAVVILVGLAFVAIFADAIAPHSPEIGSLGARFKPPVWQEGGKSEFLLGTDHLGRDVLSRLLFGARVSMVVGLLAVVVAGTIGTGLGILSGYMGKWVDQVVMRVTDTWLALPALTFAIFLAAVLGPSEMNIVIILSAVYWTRYARVIRGEVLSLKLLEVDDHEAAHPPQRAELGHRARVTAARRGDRRRGVALVPRCRRAAAQARLGSHAGRRQEGPDGGILVAHRAAGRGHHAHGALRQPSGGLAPGEARSAVEAAVDGAARAS